MRFTCVVLATVLACGIASANDNFNLNQPKAPLSNDHELLLPANYRSWVSLESTIPGMPVHRHKHVVSRVYVEPSAYDAFLTHGVWPDHTVIVLELRDRTTPPKHMCDGMIGLEVAAKDSTRVPDPWSYYGIIYDHDKRGRKAETKSICADCGQSIDTRLAAFFPALRAVIHGRPEAMQPAAF